MCVCVYVCMDVCMCVMYACMYVCMYVYMYVCVYVCMYECMYVCMYACMYVWMYVCMYVCMFGGFCYELSQQILSTLSRRQGKRGASAVSNCYPLSQPPRLHNLILFVLHIFRFSEIGIIEHSFPCVYNKLVNL